MSRVMPLPSGTRFGSYEILSQLGSGGMGEVYRAHDDVLRRDVAIKIVAARQLGDTDGLARFEREARLLAALNHPNISAIYGLVEAGGVRGIVMELVDGPTLKEIIEGPRSQAPGPRETEKALLIARQLIDALEAAHEKGIVHRDLKPANIKVTASGTVKVLDFGIAKALASATGDRSEATTIEATEQGTIVGTAAYMSPEQARGQAVDARADIWAFGAVLYELLTRRKAFTGGTATDVMAALLTKEPDWSAIPRDTSAGVVRLLRRCLEKDPARRLRHIADARFEIEDAAAMPVASKPVPARSNWRLLGLIGTALVGGAVLGLMLRPLLVRSDGAGSRAAGAVVFGFAEPPGTKFNLFSDPIKVSPDGTRIALAPISPDGKSRVWLRSLGSATPERLEGTEGATFPFWSPDGKSIGFNADGQLKVIDLSSRTVRAIAPWTGGLGGSSWNADGVIVFADVGSGLKRVMAIGGDVKAATTLDIARGEAFHAAPCFLPDNRHFLYVVGGVRPEQGGLMIGALDSPETIRLPIRAIVRYAAPGYLLYARGGELVAQQFDTDRLALVGDPMVVGSGVRMSNTAGMVALSASSTGTLTFAATRSATTQLMWFDRSGRRGDVLGQPGEWVHLALSPDEHTVAAERLDPRSGEGTIWMIDADRNLPSRLTQDPAWSMGPLWSKDGRRVVFGSSRSGDLRVYSRSADGSGADEALPVLPGINNPTDWTPDGRLVFTSMSPTGPTILTVPVTSGAQAAPLVDKEFSGLYGKISPDGRWLAYVSAESGKVDVFVRAMSGPGRWAISRNGGLQPRWRRDGKELYYVADDWIADGRAGHDDRRHVQCRRARATPHSRPTRRSRCAVRLRRGQSRAALSRQLCRRDRSDADRDRHRQLDVALAKVGFGRAAILPGHRQS